jgi:hypothetical protein
LLVILAFAFFVQRNIKSVAKQQSTNKSLKVPLLVEGGVEMAVLGSAASEEPDVQPSFVHDHLMEVETKSKVEGGDAMAGMLCATCGQVF